MKRTTVRFGLGVAAVAAVAAALLAVLAVCSLSWLSQTASADPDGVVLVHVNPDGTDFVGNPFCPQTVWSGGLVVSVADWHDCNNTVGQNHLLRTEGYEDIADDDGDGNPRAGFPAVGAAELLCDGLDNDADTEVDDGTCVYPETPADACNGIDDDLDGVVDDGACIDEDPVNDFDDDGDTLVDEDPPNITGWTLQNAGANAAIVGEGNCWTQAEVQGRPNFNPENWNEQCIVIRSTAPGETIITASYDVPSAVPPVFGEVTNALVKQWDVFVDTVILQGPDVEPVTVPGMGSQLLPKDVDGDGNRDAADEHLMDHNGETQDHALIFDEALKLTRSADGPILLIEAVHGQHVDFPDHPTEGAIVLAFIDSPRGCTYFTNASGDIDGDGDRDALDRYGTAVVGVTDWLGFFIGPQLWPSGAQFTAEALAEAAAHGLESGESNAGPDAFAVDDLLGVYVDTQCEEQATITFKVGYPDFIQSVPEIPAPESVTINWITIELAKQPQIRWAGEEIVLEKRWALPGDWYPELGAGLDNDGDTLINEDPADDDRDGAVDEDPAEEVAGVCNNAVDDDEDGVINDGCPTVGADPESAACLDALDNDADGKINDGCPVVDKDERDEDQDGAIDEDTGRVQEDDDDGDGAFDEDGPDICPLAGSLVKYTKLVGPGGLISGLPDIVPPEPSEPGVVWTIVDESCVSRALYFSEEPGQVDVEALLLDGDGNPVNKHAFLVWYLKIYQVKLENIPLTDNVGREFHNAGPWQGGDPITAEGLTEETLNVSQDALARVQVKGYFYGGNPSGRGDACIDMDGDGDGAGSEPGAPYPATIAEGCGDFDDHALAGGYWVLPDDIEGLAGPDPDRLASWDVMSEPDVAAEDLIGPKSALDSHDDVLRRFVDCVVLKPGPGGEVVPDFTCKRKTVDPDGLITAADAIMPPLKILAQIQDNGDGVLDVGESGFLKMADKGADLNIKSAYQGVEIPASPYIPAVVGNGGYGWDSWGFNGPAQGPYAFYGILTKEEELDALGRPYIRSFEFYTDNRGQGFFFVDGDFKLTYDDCPRQQLSGTPDCSPGDVVGKSVVDVIGDYPYFRKHPAVQSNLVEKTWTWGGFKSVTAERIDATHTAIVAHLRDRDGYCKWDVGADPTEADSVTFSPSLNEVQHEWIEFLLNTDVGLIRDISPNALYLGDVADQHSYIDPGLPLWQVVQIQDHVHSPLAEEWSTGLEPDMGRIFEADREAVARAEDVRVLNFYGEGRSVDENYTDPAGPDECQAWVVIEHPADQDPDVSVVFHDPEGTIDRHWPLSQFLAVLVPGWNDSCYTAAEQPVDDAVADLLVDSDGNTILDLIAIYRLNAADQAWERYFPGRPDISNIATLNPYDQLFILMEAGANWAMEITTPPTGATLVEGWNSVCYAGASESPDEATANIQGDFAVLYTVGSDQGWRRYVPGEAWATNIVTLNQFTSVSMLVTAAGGATWTFDPPSVPNAPASLSPEVSARPEPDATVLGIPTQVEMCGLVFPGTYLGTVTFQGAPAPDGTVVWASVGGILWASATTSGGLYVLDAPAVLPVSPPCFAGGQMTFTVGGLTCQESPTWSSGLHWLNLSCGELATKVRVGSGQAPPAGQVTVPLEALGVPPSGLAAFTVDISYEAGVVTPTGYVGDPGGHFDSVLCNLNYGPSTIRCSGVRATPDAAGDVPLADLTFDVAPAAAVGYESPLLVTVPTFADAQGYPIPHDTQDGSILVGLVGNVDCDGDVDAVDALFILQYVVGLRGASDQCPPPPRTLYLPSADVDCDGDADAVDSLFVLQYVVGLRPELGVCG